MARSARPEDVIQRAVFQHIAQRGVPGLVAFHVPQGNKLGGKRSAKGVAIQGSINKGLGVVPGVSDIIALHDGKFYALELKAEGGTPSENQLKFIARVNDSGGFAVWVVGLDRALHVLEGWGLLRGTAT